MMVINGYIFEGVRIYRASLRLEINAKSVESGESSYRIFDICRRYRFTQRVGMPELLYF